MFHNEIFEFQHSWSKLTIYNIAPPIHHLSLSSDTITPPKKKNTKNSIKKKVENEEQQQFARLQQTNWFEKKKIAQATRKAQDSLNQISLKKFTHMLKYC